MAPALAGLAVFAALLGARGLVPAPFDRLRLAAFDAFQRAAPRVRAAHPVIVVDIDEDSLVRFGQWPWARSTVADLIENLQDLDASVVALDIVFSEPDRTSPARLISDLERRFGFRGSIPANSLPDHDARLAEAFARGQVVAGFGLLPAPNGREPAAFSTMGVIGSDPRLTIARFDGAVPNLPLLDEAAAGHGSFTIAAGSDEIIRRLPLLMSFGDRLVPSLALDALRVMQDEGTIKVRAERSGSTLTGYTVRVGDTDLPLDASGSLWLHHPGARSTPTVSAWRILDPVERERVRAEVQGRAVFVGTSAVGLADLRPTPMTPFEPGVNLHADALEQVLSGHTLGRPAWIPGLETLVSFLLAAAIGAATAFASLRLTTSLIVVALPALWFGALWAFSGAGLLLDPTFPAVAVATVFSGSSLVRYAGTDRASQRLKSAFTHYLSPDLVAALATDPGKLKLGGESREMTFLFTDLEGFTSLTETAGAEALVHLLNGYLDGMCRIAMEHGGTVDKIVGDAVHVMFNAPLDQPDHAARGVAAALAIDVFAEAFKAEQRRLGVPFGTTRIGVNTGTAVVGNFGGSRRFDYTAHGDAINTAARLEAANKSLGTRICVSRPTVERVEGHAFRPVGTLMLKGKSIGVDVFEPMIGPAGADAAYRDAFARLIAGDESGAADLLRLHEADPADPILALHARRIRAGERSVRMAA